MIECPFCGEQFEAEEMVYEFSWGDVTSFLYHNKQLTNEPKAKFQNRQFYVTLKYDWRGKAMLDTCSAYINPSKHIAHDPLMEDQNDWGKVVQLLSRKRIFEADCSPEDKKIPTGAKILPMIRGKKRKDVPMVEGMSTGVFCPLCEQQLKPEVLRTKEEIRILLNGRPGSGKTVYVTQAISELMQGRQTQDFTIEAANHSVQEHYRSNKELLKALGNGFVLATNPGTIQDPYIFLIKNGKNAVRLVIQDIAGEDTENRTKYSKAVRKADMILFFVDPWHIEEVRTVHQRYGDGSNAVVERSTMGRYSDLAGVFHQMLSTVDEDFTEKSGQLAGVLMMKGDYLIPPMLEQGSQPECQMMQQPVPYNNPEEMEFSLGMRSSFVRQCMNEWDSTRILIRDIEGKYRARNIRYFVSSALGQSTYLRQTGSSEDHEEDPNAQFNVNDSEPRPSSGVWNYGEQVLESPAKPMHVVDPILWCLKRKGIKF